jgi:hypothetical protein
MSVAFPVLSAGVILAPANSTVRWGTGGALVSAIVISIDEDEEVDIDYVPQGDGVKAIRVTTKHGKRWNITCVDTGLAFNTPPAVGTTVLVVTDMIAGTGAGYQMTANRYNAAIISNNYRAGRKVEGQRTLQVENLTLIDSQTPV